ncbi:MAG TPA: sensor histidine kinase [Fimbriimonas sp.]
MSGLPNLRRLASEYSSSRTRHIVFLVHVWLCAPFMLFWLSNTRIQQVLGPVTILRLRYVVAFTLLYLLGRTWLALKNPRWLRWEYVFPPIDVLVISLILLVSNRGPMSNLTLLYFLPIVEASGALKVRWAAAVGFMVVAGMAVATLVGGVPPPPPGMTYEELLKNETLNVVFRLYFLVLISSLMAYQAVIAAELREKLGVVADRNRIAMEMHDGVQGSLISLASSLELIGHLAPRDGQRAAELARESRETARQAADELRFLVQRLRNPSLSQGFVPALRQYAHNICERNGLRLEFIVEGTERPIEAEKENALFRIAQEALNNVIKHSAADGVELKVVFFDGHVDLKVRDDGHGFDMRSTDGQVGLQSMRERAERLGGKVLVNSDPGSGTSVSATL